MLFTDGVFNEVCLKTSLQLKSREMIRKVLVGGVDPVTVATESRVSRQTIYKAIKVFRVQYNKDLGLPESWKQSELLLSPELLKKVKKMQNDEISSLKNFNSLKGSS